MSDTFNQDVQSHFAMEEQFAADMAPATVGKTAKIFLMFSLIAFGAIGGYVNAHWESYKDVLGFASAESSGSDNICPASKRSAPPGYAMAACSADSDTEITEGMCPISGKAPSCCSHKEELNAAMGGESPCCSQMNKAIVAAMLEVKAKSETDEKVVTEQQDTTVSTETESAVTASNSEEK